MMSDKFALDGLVWRRDGKVSPDAGVSWFEPTLDEVATLLRYCMDRRTPAGHVDDAGASMARAVAAALVEYHRPRIEGPDRRALVARLEAVLDGRACDHP